MTYLDHCACTDCLHFSRDLVLFVKLLGLLQARHCRIARRPGCISDSVASGRGIRSAGTTYSVRYYSRDSQFPNCNLLGRQVVQNSPSGGGDRNDCSTHHRRGGHSAHCCSASNHLHTPRPLSACLRSFQRLGSIPAMSSFTQERVCVLYIHTHLCAGERGVRVLRCHIHRRHCCIVTPQPSGTLLVARVVVRFYAPACAPFSDIGSTNEVRFLFYLSFFPGNFASSSLPGAQQRHHTRKEEEEERSLIIQALLLRRSPPAPIVRGEWSP